MTCVIPTPGRTEESPVGVDLPSPAVDVDDSALEPPLRSRRNRRRILGIAVIVLILGVEIAWLGPYVVRGLGQLSNIHWPWLIAAFAAENASMMSFARLQRVMLRTGGIRVRLRSAVATAFAGNALSVTLPGGSVASLAYTTRRMKSWGASGPLVGFSLAATGALSTISLTLLAAAGTTAAGDLGQLGWVIAEIVGIGALLVAGVALLKHPMLIRRIVDAALRGWNRLRPSAVPRGASVHKVLGELATLNPGTRTWVRGLALAFVNWAADLLCLLAACRAVGASPALSTVLLAYAAGMAAASAIPLLPSGLGAVDAALVIALQHGGVTSSSATAADLIYRIISFGMVALAGWTVLLVQRRRMTSVDERTATIAVLDQAA